MLQQFWGTWWLSEWFCFEIWGFHSRLLLLLPVFCNASLDCWPVEIVAAATVEWRGCYLRRRSSIERSFVGLDLDCGYYVAYLIGWIQGLECKKLFSNPYPCFHWPKGEKVMITFFNPFLWLPFFNYVLWLKGRRSWWEKVVLFVLMDLKQGGTEERTNEFSEVSMGSNKH